MRVVVAEDSPADEKLLRSLLGRYFLERDERVELLVFEDGEQLVEARQTDGDVYFLDIEMPRVDGLHVARWLRDHGVEAPVCFTTGLGHLAPEGYKVDAMAFLVKPLSYLSFKDTMDRIVGRIESRRRRLVPFKDGKAQKYIDVNDVAFIESSHKRTLIHTAARVYCCSEPLKALEARFGGEAPFFRVHSAFLVNLGYVDSFADDDIVVCGQPIPVSKHRKKEFLSSLTAYVGRQL